MKIEIEIDDIIMEQALIDGWNLAYEGDNINAASLPPIAENLDGAYVDDIIRGLGSCDVRDMIVSRVL